MELKQNQREQTRLYKMDEKQHWVQFIFRKELNMRSVLQTEDGNMEYYEAMLTPIFSQHLPWCSFKSTTS